MTRHEFLIAYVLAATRCGKLYPMEILPRAKTLWEDLEKELRKDLGQVREDR